MQRPGWSGTRGTAEPGDRTESISKHPRSSLWFAANDRRTKGQRLRDRRALLYWLLLLTALFLLWAFKVEWGLASKPASYNVAFKSAESAAFAKQIDLLISQSIKEQQASLNRLQPLFSDWQAAKTEASELVERSRLAEADTATMEELHQQRLKNSNDFSAAQRKAYEENFQESKRSLSRVREEEARARAKESDLRVQVELLRLETQAFGSAATEFRARQKASDMAPLKGAKQPGNVFDRTMLIEAFGGGIEGLKTKHSKRELVEIQALDHQLGKLSQIKTVDDVEGKALPLHEHAAVADQGGSKKTRSGGSRAMLPQDVEQDRRSDSDDNLKLKSDPIKAQEDQQQLTLDTVAEGSNPVVESVLRSDSSQELASLKERKGENVLDPQGSKPNWLSQRWGDRPSGILGPRDLDDSIRCQRSGLCEGLESCKVGGKDRLGCLKTAEQRQEAVREAVSWSWEGYKQYAFGHDELKPLSKSYETWFDLGLTLVDSLDTFLLLGMDAEYEEARKWVASNLKLDPDKAVNLFETTIRIVGGLLAAFHLSHGDKVMLYKATALALRLVPAFDSPSEIPFSDVNLKTHRAEPPHWTTHSSLAEVTTLSMEFSYIARATGETEPIDKALKTVYKILDSPGKLNGLAPLYVDTNDAKLIGHTMTLGARGDSYYEYLLDQWLLSGKTDDKLLKGYLEAMQGVRKHMLMRTDHDGLLFVGEVTNRNPVERFPKMDHLVCFLPGLLALGHSHGLNSALPGEPDDLAVAEDLMRTCYEMYRRTPTGLAPELAFFETSEAGHSHGIQMTPENSGGGDFVIKPHDAHNLLRPETVESLLVLKLVTEKPHYQEWAWEIFRAFHMHSIVETGGYANLDSCLEIPAPKRDKMESFWLAETLKYIYLALDDSSPPLINLHEVVFNTEAHPLPVAKSATDTLLSKSYISEPYKGLANLTLDARINYWETLAALETEKAQQLPS